MHSPSSEQQTVWQRLKTQQIDCATAIEQLVDKAGNLSIDRLDPEVSTRFWRHFSDKSSLPPAIPLLLWRGCYYLATPIELTTEQIATITARTNTKIEIIRITSDSYRDWYHHQHISSTQKLDAQPLVNPLTGETEAENITATTQIYLSKAADQIERIKTLLSGALRNRASDIHLEPTLEGLKVRYRIDGVLRNITTLPTELSRKVIVALKVMSNMDISESRRPQDGRISETYTTGDTAHKGMDLRVSTLPCVGGEKAVIRLLPRENPFSQLENLGFSANALQTYKTWLSQPQGMIILTGPTGSGKTSTLYTSLQTVATENVNVVTVEDPVEYVLPRITQTQVNEAAGMTFAAGLRAILRQDPDIIMVGEIRDSETAETAIRAALTGHLVFTTLHTNDAVGAIPRLRDIGPDPGLISDALLGVVAQRLVRRVCPHCSDVTTPTAHQLQLLGLDANTCSNFAWRRGRGCAACFDSGYLGREAIVELLDVDATVRQIIYDGSMSQLHRYLDAINFASFRAAAIAKLAAGLTTADELLRVLPHSVFAAKSVTKDVNGHFERVQVN